MDVSILYFAVPQISRDLGSSPTEQLWIFDIYGFVLAGLLVTTGAIADRIGPRRLLLIGAVAFSRDLARRGVLPVLRPADRRPRSPGHRRRDPDAVDPVDDPHPVPRPEAARPGHRRLDRHHDRRSRSRPVVSGILLEHFWWGSVFLVNIPAMALLLVAGPLLLPRGETHERRFDLVSSALSLGAVLPAIYGIKEWAAHGWDLRWPVCIAVGALLGWLFVRRQRRHVAPMIAPELMANPRYRIALFGNAICSFALIGNAVLITAYLQLVLGYGPLEAALWSLVPTVAVGSTAPFAAGLGQRFGMTRVAAAGLVIGAAGFGGAGHRRHRLARPRPGGRRRAGRRPRRHHVPVRRAGARLAAAEPGRRRLGGLRGRQRAGRRARDRPAGQRRGGGVPRGRRGAPPG